MLTWFARTIGMAIVGTYGMNVLVRFVVTISGSAVIESHMATSNGLIFVSMLFSFGILYPIISFLGKRMEAADRRETMFRQRNLKHI